ncbi:MAG: ATP-binding protein [bacterium]|nr:ATP-binding protein [bacterium]
MKIRTKLSIAFVIVSIIPMVIAVYLAITVNIRLLRTAVYNQLTSTIPFIEQSKKRYLTRTESAARLLASNPQVIKAIRNRDKLMLEREFKQVLERIGVHEVVYLNPAQLQSDFFPKGNKIQQVSNPVWQGYLPPAIEPRRGLMMVTVYKIEYNGKLLGGVRVGYQFEKNIAEGIMATSGVNAAVFPIDSAAFKKIASTQLLNRLVHQGLSYYATEFLISDIQYQALFIPLKSSRGETNAVVFLGLPQQPIDKLWNKYRNMFYFVTIVSGGIFAIIIAWFMARGFSKPIRELAGGAEQIAAGNFEQRIPIRSRDELGELASTFNHMAQKLYEHRLIEEQLRLKDKLAALGQLSAGLAHEIRNPLTIIKNAAELIQRKFDPQTSEYKQIQYYILDEANRVNLLITDFLTFAKPRPPNMVQCNVETIIDRTLTLARSQLVKQAYQIEWHNQTSAEDYLSVDLQQIQQVFLNLILNACQAMPSGGKLTITAFRANVTEVGVSFSDQGVGIPHANQSKIFDPFFTTKEEGTGLGLAIAHQIIETHGGRIEVSSEPNRGTTFTVYLPLVRRES